MIGRLSDSQRIQRVLINLSSNIIIDFLVILSSFTYVFTVSASTAWFCMLSIPLFGCLAWRYNRKIVFKQREVMQNYAITESKYIDTIQGIRVIKAGNNEAFLTKMVKAVYDRFQEKVYELGILGNIMGLWTQIASVVIISMVIAWTSFLILEKQLLLGQMMAIITVVSSLVSSVINVTMSNIQFQEARIAFDRMYEFSSAKPEYITEEMAIQNAIEINTIELKDLNYRFPGKKLLLSEINMIFKRGQISTIFGEIGCGKSTIISILQRFYPFESGEIYLNNSSWSNLSVPFWRSQIGVVSQHVKLFNGTILENICIEESININEVRKFCQETGFESFIKEFQQGYATIVNENGSNLSGGQQQLISLAHALYHKPQVLLLDEATAAMDRRTELFVLNLLKQKRNEMIVVFVTHRVQIARKTDYIYVIENKKIASCGTHEDLVKSNSLYRDAFEDIS